MNVPQDEIDEFVSASGRGDLKCMRTFLSENPGAIDAPDSTGYTALATAAHYGWKLSINMLLGWGADINGRSDGGRTALMEAAAQGNTEAVKVLLEKGADASLRDDDGFTAHTFASQMSHDEIVALFAPPAAVAEPAAQEVVPEPKPEVLQEAVLDKLRQFKPKRSPFAGGPRL